LVGLLAVCFVLVVTAYGRVRLNRALRDAVDRGDVAAVRSLLDRGADPNTRYPFKVVETGVEGIMARVALTLGVSGQEDEMPTVLMAAACGQKTEIAKLLVAKGADVNAEIDASFNALNWAWLTKNRELETFLRNAGAK
jgi:ankyrin repeat protein